MYTSQSRKIKLFPTLIFLLICTVAFAQPKDNDPYSYLGLGSFLNPYNAAVTGSGGLSATYNSFSRLNVQNPASLGALKLTALEVGAYAKRSKFDDGNMTNEQWSGNLGYLSLGFPIFNPLNEAAKRNPSPVSWGMSVTLTPYTQVGYFIRNTEEINNLSGGLDTVNYDREGFGGTYKLLWSNGVTYKNFSAGVNLGYIFGKMERNESERITDISFPYSNDRVNDISLGGVFGSFGVQYNHTFKQSQQKIDIKEPKLRMIIGAFGNSATTVNTKTSSISRRIGNIGVFTPDTISSTSLQSGEVTLPSEYTFGIAFEKDTRWRIGLEYTAANWSKFKSEINSNPLSDTYRFKIGGEYTPDWRSYNKYLERVTYRLGFNYGTDPRSPDVNGINTQLTDYNISFGMGMPLKFVRSLPSNLDWALEIGKFGHEDYISSNYYRLTIGFTLNDNSWFYKQKYK